MAIKFIEQRNMSSRLISPHVVAWGQSDIRRRRRRRALPRARHYARLEHTEEPTHVTPTTFSNLKSIDAIEKAVDFLLGKVDSIIPELIKSRKLPITEDDVCRIRARLNSDVANPGLLSELFYMLEEVRKHELLSDLKCKSLQKSLEKVHEDLADANYILSKYRKTGAATEVNNLWSTDIHKCVSTFAPDGDQNDILAIVDAETMTGTGSGAKFAVYRDGSVRIRQKYPGTGYKVGDVLRIRTVIHDTDDMEISSDGSVSSPSCNVVHRDRGLSSISEHDDASSVTSIQSAEIISSKLVTQCECTDTKSETHDSESTGCEFVSIIVVADTKETGSSAFVQVTLSESKISYNPIVSTFYKFCSIPGNDPKEEKLRLQRFKEAVDEFGEYIALRRFARPDAN